MAGHLKHLWYANTGKVGFRKIFCIYIQAATSTRLTQQTAVKWWLNCSKKIVQLAVTNKKSGFNKNVLSIYMRTIVKHVHTSFTTIKAMMVVRLITALTAANVNWLFSCANVRAQFASFLQGLETSAVWVYRTFWLQTPRNFDEPEDLINIQTAVPVVISK
jgi:hypothetical protein